MKCLTLWQPFASLILAGIKTTETRAWSTAYRGPLLIHAGQKLADLGLLSSVGLTNPDLRRLLGRSLQSLPRCGILGVVNLDGCWTYAEACRSREPRDIQLAMPGAVYYWKLTGPKLFPDPIPCMGNKGLWDTDDNFLADSLQKALAALS